MIILIKNVAQAMADVINELFSSIATITKNSLEIQKEREFTSVKRGIDYSIATMKMSDLPLHEIDSKEKYLSFSKNLADDIYNDVKETAFSSQDPMAGEQIYNYISAHVDSVMKYQIERYGKNAGKATQSLIKSAADGYVSGIASGKISLGDAIKSAHSMVDKSIGSLGAGEAGAMKKSISKRLIGSAVSVVDPYDEEALSDISSALSKYGDVVDNAKIQPKVGKMLSEAQSDNFQKDLTNIIESKSVTRQTSFRNGKLRDAYNLIREVKDYSVNELRNIADSTKNSETAEVLRRRASFVDRSMKTDSLSFIESQEGVRQSSVAWDDINDVATFTKSLNKTTSKMKSIGEVSTVLSKENKAALKLHWKNAGTAERANIAESLLNNSEAFQTSVLSKELAKEIPEMAAFMEFISLDPANEAAYMKLIDNSGDDIQKPQMEKVPFTLGLINKGSELGSDSIKSIQYSYPDDVGGAIIKSLKKVGLDDDISKKVKTWIDPDNLTVVPRINKGDWIDPSLALKEVVRSDAKNLYKALGEESRKFYISAGGENIPYDEYDVNGDDIVLRNYGFGTYKIHIKSPTSGLIMNELKLVYEDGSPVVFKLNDVVDRISSMPGSSLEKMVE